MLILVKLIFFNVNICISIFFKLNKMERKVTITFTSPLHMHVLDTTMAHFFPLKYWPVLLLMIHL